MMPSEIEQSTGSAFGPGDPTMERAIATRRQLEAERLQRIKDPKSRIMGIDMDALGAQVAEKQMSTTMEKTLNLKYDEQRLQQDAQLAYLEQERLRAERTKAQYLDQFRATEQGKDKAREYDLNDPLYKKNDLPARCSDDDPRLSVSGLQKFHGEDLSYAHRVKVQQEEMRQWCNEVRVTRGSSEHLGAAALCAAGHAARSPFCCSSGVPSVESLCWAAPPAVPAASARHASAWRAYRRLSSLPACACGLAAWLPGLAWPGLAWPGLAWPGLGL